jgi:hypothetical protein
MLGIRKEPIYSFAAQQVAIAHLSAVPGWCLLLLPLLLEDLLQ